MRDALEFGSPCPQPVYPSGGWASIENTANASEDCLFLNVVAPAVSEPGKPWPVIVYLPAGEFHYGASSDRESDWPFFADDIVFVTANSRIGALGFLGAEALRARSASGGTGNYGILDQRLALQWVRRNIGAFGGNAGNVALMGESSGGASVAAHMVAPHSWGLFHKAIMQSPGLTQVKRPKDAELNFQFLLAVLAGQSPRCARREGYVSFEGARVSSGRAGYPLPIRELKGLNTSQAEAACDVEPRCVALQISSPAAAGEATTVLLYDRVHQVSDVRAFLAETGGAVTMLARAGADGEAGAECVGLASAGMLSALTYKMPRDDTFETDAWAPLIDGVEMRTSLLEAFGAGDTAPNVSVLLGSNLDEGTEFMYLAPPINCNATAVDFSAWAVSFYGPTLGPAVEDAYQTLEQPLPPCLARAPAPADAARRYMAAMRSAGDYAITCKVRQVALGLARGSSAGRGGRSRVYSYFFRHAPATSINWKNTTGYGAFHGAEVPLSLRSALVGAVAKPSGHVTCDIATLT